MTTSSTTYHIIGGGVAGLSCAWFLKQKCPNARAVVYEAAPQLGGRAYSYQDKGMGCRLDNAVHAIVGANKFMAQFVKKDEWETTKYFIDVAADQMNDSLYQNWPHLLKAFCNTTAGEIDPKIKRQILKEAFPLNASKRRVWYSKQNLSQRIINILAGYADEIHLNCRLQKIAAQFGVAAQLDFGKNLVDIGAGDKVIIALDNLNCSRLMNLQPLEHSQIVNIIYQTSQTIFLPRGASFVGVCGGIADWVFVGGNLLSVVISDYTSGQENLSDLAIKIWAEIDKIRGVNSAFMPPFKAVCCKNATIRQDAKNNRQRPKNALSVYPNVFLAGDWTMQNYPCCMETAVKSAQRAINTALKSA